MLAIISFALIAITAAIPLPEKRNIFMPAPYNDPFYVKPDNLDQLKNGEIYNTRRVFPDLQFSIQFAEAYQVAYKTSDPHGNASHTIATVFKPLIPSSEPRLFSYQFYEDSTELNCSPSYSIAKGLLAPDSAVAIADSAISIQFGLSKGWYVVVADHEGPHSAFIEGHTEGQAGLDGIRAAISHLELATDVKVALLGYSGGASASVWMTNLHESYAPELNIVGAAFGGTPVDLTATVEWLDKADNMFSGFIVGAFTGMLNAFPDVRNEIWPHLHATLQNAINTMDSPNNCILTEVLEFGHQEWHTQMDVDFYTYKPLADLLAFESLFKNETTSTYSVPKFPRYMFHAEGDEVLPFTAAERYVEEQCAQGSNIQWVPWKGNDHVSVDFLGLPDAYQFLIQAFDGTTPQLKCGTHSNDILTLGSAAVGDTIGNVIADLIKGFSGLTTPLGKIDFDPQQPYQS